MQPLSRKGLHTMQHPIEEPDLHTFILSQLTTVPRPNDDPAALCARAEDAVLVWAQAALLHLPRTQQAAAEQRALAALALARNAPPDLQRQLASLCLRL